MCCNNDGKEIATRNNRAAKEQLKQLFRSRKNETPKTTRDKTTQPQFRRI
jgi:hypothetical protein